MRKTKLSDGQIMGALKRFEASFGVHEICRKMGISIATFYKWRPKYGGKYFSMMSRTNELEEQNRRLKRRMYFEEKLKAEIVLEALEKMVRPFLRNDMAIKAVKVIRCDSGSDDISAAIQNWAAEWGIRLEYLQPGNPQENGYVEKFNITVRYDWLSQYYWASLEEVQEFATRWMRSYNNDRPNIALGGFTPKQKLAMAA